MKHRLEGYTLIHGEIISPEVVIAKFNPGLTLATVKEMVAALNHGHEMLMLYKQHRDNMHIANVAVMLERMETICMQWNMDVFAARRTTKEEQNEAALPIHSSP
jgi:hypothetical protein